jgi:hypothetical protein
LTALRDAGLPEWFYLQRSPGRSARRRSNPHHRHEQNLDRTPSKWRSIPHSIQFKRRFRTAFGNGYGRGQIHFRTGPPLHAVIHHTSLLEPRDQIQDACRQLPQNHVTMPASRSEGCPCPSPPSTSRSAARPRTFRPIMRGRTPSAQTPLTQGETESYVKICKFA